jgi:hypothetical protein
MAGFCVNRAALDEAKKYNLTTVSPFRPMLSAELEQYKYTSIVSNSMHLLHCMRYSACLS